MLEISYLESSDYRICIYSTMGSIDEKSMHASDHIECTNADTVNVKTEKGSSISDEEFATIEKRLVRKLDCTLVPMVWLLYLFNYLDRNSIA